MIRLEGFIGRLPRVDDAMLPPNAATVAHDTDLTRGVIRPMNLSVGAGRLSKVAAGFTVLGSELVPHDNAFTSVVQGPIAADRRYVTDHGTKGEAMIVDGQTLDMGVPRPTREARTEVRGTATSAGALAETVVYAYSWVTDYGEESVPSPLSVARRIKEGQVMRVTNWGTPPAGRRISKVRLYRSQTGGTGATDLFFVDDIAVAATFYDHDISIRPINEPIQSVDYDVPLAGMRGITAMPNGIMAAFKGRELLFSEPYLPHAWPIKYRLKTKDPIIGIVSFGSSLGVLTENTPYIVQGLHPETMAMTQSEDINPCQSRRGIVDMGYAAAYPGVEGLVIMGEQGASLRTLDLFTPKQWREMRPETFVAAYYAGRYVFSYAPPGQSTRRMGMIDLRGDAPYFRSLGAVHSFITSDRPTGRLLALDDDGRTIKSIDDDLGAEREWRWRSKPFLMPAGTIYGAVKIDGSGDVRLTLNGDGQDLVTVEGAGVIHRLPAARVRQYQIAMTGTGIVSAVRLAHTPGELVGG